MRRFAQVDVFSTGPFTGNPLAVVLDAEGLADDEMRAFARWTNLSETAFLLPPTAEAADYRVRIFQPSGELPFAGHPTLGSCSAWLAAGGVPRSAEAVIQECGVGLVPVRDDGDTLAFAAPPRRRTGPLPASVLHRAIRCLGVAPQDVVDHEWGDNGPPWAMVRLDSDAAVRAISPDVSALGDIYVGVVGLTDVEGGHAYEVRAFVPPPSPTEDPVTGSLNAAVAQWLRARRAVPASYAVRQGSALGRAGEVLIEDDGADIWVGGRVTTVIRGSLLT